nr:outer membrane protein assembly factor BamE [Pseudomonas sp. UBA6718]
MHKAIAAGLLMFAIAGCAGTNFSYDNARRVKVGMTEAEVTQLMGQPYSVVSTPGGQMWVWSHANGFSGSSRSISFKFDQGRVTEVPSIPASFH